MDGVVTAEWMGIALRNGWGGDCGMDGDCGMGGVADGAADGVADGAGG